jgi:hypothetical protein
MVASDAVHAIASSPLGSVPKSSTSNTTYYFAPTLATLGAPTTAYHTDMHGV